LVGFCGSEELRQRVLSDWKSLGWVSGVVKPHTLYSDVVGMPEGFGEYLYWPSQKCAEGGSNDVISMAVDKQVEQALNTLLINKISLLGVFYPPMPITQVKAPSPESILFASRRGVGEPGLAEGERTMSSVGLQNVRTHGLHSDGGSMVHSGTLDYDYDYGGPLLTNTSMGMHASHEYVDQWHPSPEQSLGYSSSFGHEDAGRIQGSAATGHPSTMTTPSMPNQKKGSCHNKIRSTTSSSQKEARHYQQDHGSSSMSNSTPIISPQAQSVHSTTNASVLSPDIWCQHNVGPSIWSTTVSDLGGTRNDGLCAEYFCPPRPVSTHDFGVGVGLSSYDNEHYGLSQPRSRTEWDSATSSHILAPTGDYQSYLPYVAHYHADLLHPANSSSASSPYFGPSSEPADVETCNGGLRPLRTTDELGLPRSVDVPVPPKTSDVPVPSFMSRFMAKNKSSLTQEEVEGETRAVMMAASEEAEDLKSWMQ